MSAQSSDEWWFFGCLEAYTPHHSAACIRECLRHISKVCEVAYASVFQFEGFVEVLKENP